MAITLTEGTSDTVRATVDFELDLYAGALVDSTRWLDGAGGASGDYPGSLNPFLPTNTDSTNTAGRGLKLVCARITTAPANTDLLTIGGDADTVHAVNVGGSGAGVCTAAISGADITFTVSGTITAPISLWIICS